MNRKQRINILAFAVITILVTAGYLGKRSLWHKGVVRGRQQLSQAMQDFRETGRLRDYSSWGATFIYTNCETLGGTNYQCAVAYNDPHFYSEGFLAITTNNAFIYFDKKHGPKLIPAEGPFK